MKKSVKLYKEVLEKDFFKIMLNVAVIGCGKHFEYFHLKSFKRLSKNFNIHGIYDVDYKRSKKFKKSIE